MPHHRVRILAALPLVASVCALTAFAAPAGAATLTAPACAVDFGVVRSLGISGTGFAPNSFVTLKYTSSADPTPQTLTGADVNPLGSFVTTAFPASFHSSNTTDQTFNLSASDGVNSAATSFRQVRFGGSAKPNKGRPSRKVRYTARGFVPNKTVYLHFRFGGKTRSNVKLGTAKAPCGVASRKTRLLPARVRYGTWTVYIDQKKTYSKKTTLQASGPLQIFRVFH